MKEFGGPVVFLDRSDINTDEIIPAKYLTEVSKMALKPHLLEDLLLDGVAFDNKSEAMENAKVVVTRSNFGCGSSREHAVWAFEINDINIVVAESFARIFRQNMFNCGILAVELDQQQLDTLFAIDGNVTIAIDLEQGQLKAKSDQTGQDEVVCTFNLNSFDKELVAAGGWLTYADSKY